MTGRSAAPEAATPRLPVKLAAHPSVRAVPARRGSDDPGPPPVIEAGWLRELCLAAGADDAAAVSLEHPDLAGEREYAHAALPRTRTMIAMVVRMNRDNCRSPARSVANQEFHQADEQANHAARSVVQALQDAGYRAINPSVAFPHEMDNFPGKRIWVVAHKTVAVAAGLGVMGLHRNVIHPKFGSFVLLATSWWTPRSANTGRPWITTRASTANCAWPPARSAPSARQASWQPPAERPASS